MIPFRGETALHRGCATARLGEGVVAAGVENHDLQRGVGRVEALQEIIDRERRRGQALLVFDIHVDRQQVVPAVALDAMSSEIDQHGRALVRN